MDERTPYIIVAVVLGLAILGYSFGWFGGSAPPPAATVPAPTAAPATLAPVPAQ